MALIYIISTLVTFIFLLSDTFSYPTFTLEHIGIDAVMMLLFHAIFSLIIRDQIPDIFKKYNNIHQKIIFPLLILISLVLLVLEHIYGANYVYSHFHIQPFIFLYLPILSSIIVFVPRLFHEHNFSFFLYTPLVFLLAMFAFSIYASPLFSHLVKEDGYLENSQAFLFFVSSVFFFISAKKFWNNKSTKHLSIIFLVLGIGLFFISGEEISWGQRFFGIETPESIKEINVQGEITVHNLNYFQYTLPFVLMLASFYGAFSRIIVEKFFKKNNFLHLLTPPYFLIPTFIIMIIFYYQHTFSQYSFASVVGIPPTIFPQLWNEAIETVLAFCVVSYAYYVYKLRSNVMSKKRS